MIFLKAGLYSIFYGIFIELHQLLLGYRSFSFSDLLFDMAGIIAFLLLFKIIISIKNLSRPFSKI